MPTEKLLKLNTQPEPNIRISGIGDPGMLKIPSAASVKLSWEPVLLGAW